MPDRAPQEHPGEEPAADPGNHPGDRPGRRPDGRRARDSIHRDGIHRDRHSTGDAVGDAAGDDTADGSADDVDIPVPRPPLDDLPVISPPAAEDSGNEPPQNGLVEPDWRYDQHWTRGKHRRYNGYVDRIGGVEGQRLRESLAAAIRDLLDWAAKHADSNDSSDTGNNGESSKDSSRDGGADDTPE